ncbi:MAG TPA: hypothetical protein VNJ47_12715 [Nevskiales bacterium]|nr:hypothetical protein [Nevskiales bacterium]
MNPRPHPSSPLFAVLLALLAAGCAQPGPRPASPDDEVTRCRQLYAELDARVDESGARDAGSHRVPGFPYLRSTRFLASLRDAALDGERFDTWVGHLRQQDLVARAIELQNAGAAGVREKLQRLDECAQALATHDFREAQQRQRLRELVLPPSDYSVFRRMIGLYPLAVPFLNRGIRRFHEEVRRDYATPLAQLDAPGRLVLWHPPAGVQVLDPGTVAGWLSPSNEDSLGVPRLSAEQWQRLVQAYAPVWWQETNGDFDLPGVPRLPNGRPGVDSAQPVTYYLTAWTRFNGVVLPQLVYALWFSERPPQKPLDSYAGALDGVLWRVTLARDGRPLVYDTIHSCGCYRYYFPARPLARRPQGSAWDEPMLFPQGEVGGGPLAIRLQSATHYVRRVVPRGEVAAQESRPYELRPYAELLSLEDGTGRRRSLFGRRGIVPGTARLERFWLWPSGIHSPGAMRQWGRHATAFVGQAHFDDPDFLDRLFVAPPR